MKIDSRILQEIVNRIGTENVREHEEMAQHLSMRVGGPADYFMTPQTEEDAAFLVKLLNENGIKYYIMGNGSNIIVRDAGFEGVMIQFLDNYNKAEIDGNLVRAKAGIKLKVLADMIMDRSLTGFEFASGIPGTLGGAVCMNAGAYDGEMKDVVREVKMLDKQGNILVLSNDEMDFSYRHSICSSGDYVVLEALLELKPGNKEEIKAKTDDFTARRKDKQPLEYPSCGSTFKRPEGYFAGKLIMDAGLKGASVGGASVSRKHCGFIINDNNATATDVLGLIDLVKRTVKESQGVDLECEVKIL
ncbi:MAG: UDP-N-acetylmuramate dehydrogenase [Lachnospiraceae bacterium]|nr:UDP-N-acetylmuramate dehydrogenase [Lachnospiraceae bacterium]